jgi:serine/threonine-protein kinase
MTGGAKLVAPTLAARYAVERELGRGGMATVYLAEERKHGRNVAIKGLREEISASLGTDRFLREIGIIARLTHPHVIPLIDSGEADGLLYYVTPYLDGGSLRERLTRDGTRSHSEALRVSLESACEDSSASAITAAGTALGTPSYMSPEQAAGERDVGVASDVYSPACVVYEMLAGAPPFAGTGAQATMARQVTEAPRPFRILRPEFPLGVETALSRALDKVREHRFQSAGDFVTALVEATQPAPLGDIRRGLARRAAQGIAVLPFVNTSPDAENEYLSDGITDELIDALNKDDAVRVASRTSVFALKGRALDVRAIGALLDVSVVLEGSVRRQGDRLRVTAQLTDTDDGRLLWSQRYDRELQNVFAVQDELARTVASTLRTTWLADIYDPQPVKRGTESVVAYGHYLRGRWAMSQRSDAATRESIAWFERAIADDPQYALTYTGLSDAYALHVDYRSMRAGEGFERAAHFAREALRLDDALPEAHTSLAWSLFIYSWEWDAARREFERADHHMLRAVEMNPTSEENFRLLGVLLAVEGRHADAAVATMQETLSMPGADSLAQGTLAHALARVGHDAQAADIRASLASRAQHEHVSPVALATAWLGSSELERALDWIEHACADQREWVVYLNVNPIFDPVRHTDRFQSLVRRLGLPVAGSSRA